jgi:hypothetical protein
MSDKTRRERIPFSANRTRLQVDKQIAGHHLRFFNDESGRIQRALDAGYEFVKPDEIGSVGDKEVHGGNSDLNSKVSRVVGRNAQGVPVRAFLMKIRDEWRAEDMAKKEAVNKRVDEAVRVGTAGGVTVENQYGNVQLQN